MFRVAVVYCHDVKQRQTYGMQGRTGRLDIKPAGGRFCQFFSVVNKKKANNANPITFDCERLKWSVGMRRSDWWTMSYNEPVVVNGLGRDITSSPADFPPVFLNLSQLLHQPARYSTYGRSVSQFKTIYIF